MLMKPLVGPHDPAPRLPVAPPAPLALLPEKRIALPAQDDDVGARSVPVALLIGPHGKLRDVAPHRLAGQVEFHVAAALAPLAVVLQRGGMSIGDEEIGR